LLPETDNNYFSLDTLDSHNKPDHAQNDISIYPHRVRTGHWKTWKIMKFKNFIFQTWKVMEFSRQSWKIKAVYVRLVIEAVEARKSMTKM